MASVIIKLKNWLGKDEWWCDWFECPKCKVHSIANRFKFCPICGVKLMWSKEVKEKMK